MTSHTRHCVLVLLGLTLLLSACAPSHTAARRPLDTGPTATPLLLPTDTPTPTLTATSAIPPTPTTPPVFPPQFSNWSATASDPAISFTFTLDDGRTNIVAYSVKLTGYACGGGGASTDGSVSGNGTWAISNRLFAINSSMPFNATTTPFKIEGSFNISGTYMSGVWLFSPNGANCSTTWRAIGS